MKRLLLFIFFISSQMMWSDGNCGDSAFEKRLGGVIYNGAVNTTDLEFLLHQLSFELGDSSRAVYPFDTIDSSGFYKLAGNVSNQIIISSGDVTLDCNGHTVSGGIVINSTLSNITLTNGTVSGVLDDGILVNAGCTDIALKDITIKNAVRGINFEQVSNGLIRNCDLTLNTTGLELDRCRNIVIENCSAQANTNAGYSLLSSTTCSFFDCKALSTGDGNASSSGDSSFVFGFVSSAGTGNLFENCVANSTQNLSATDFNTVVAGIALKQSEQCSKIIGCEGSNSTTNPDGFAVPYGIWLEGTLDSTQSVTGILQNNASTTSWSPDGQYAAVGGNVTGGIGDRFQIIFFDRVEQSVRAVDGALGSGILVVINSVRWSPDGQYIAVGGNGLGDELQVFRFDRTSETLTNIGSILGTAGAVSVVDWAPNEQYIAVGGSGLTGGTGEELQLIKFDRVSNALTSVAGALGTAGEVSGVNWSPDGQYIAVGGSGLTGGTGDELQVFRFDRTSELLISVAGALGTAGSVNAVNWSPDGEFIAMGGDSITGGTGNEFQIFRFDRTAETLTSIAGALAAPTVAGVATVNWSPDGQYIVVGGDGLTGGTGDEFQIFRFDRTAETLTSIAGALGTDGTVGSVNWSPDGQYIAMAGVNITGGSGDAFQILDGIQFPSQNVIQHNTVYCNASNTINGVGISGSSIANMVIDNTAFDNPFNYQFVTNVFNQLFGQEPSALQNKEKKNTDPICMPEDIPQKSARIELLLESLIDNLL